MDDTVRLSVTCAPAARRCVDDFRQLTGPSCDGRDRNDEIHSISHSIPVLCCIDIWSKNVWSMSKWWMTSPSIAIHLWLLFHSGLDREKKSFCRCHQVALSSCPTMDICLVASNRPTAADMSWMRNHWPFGWRRRQSPSVDNESKGSQLYKEQPWGLLTDGSVRCCCLFQLLVTRQQPATLQETTAKTRSCPRPQTKTSWPAKEWWTTTDGNCITSASCVCSPE